jgi:signal transduction histidine kinase
VEDASELQAVRARLVSSALEERRLIERALHDGVQQDLIHLSVRIQLVRNLMATAPDEALASLDEIRHEVRDALDRVQALAADIYPAVLDARGLPAALRGAVRASRAAASVEAAELGRYPAGVEAAVAFLWRIVLDGPGTESDARIRVWEENDALRVAIEAGTAVDFVRAADLVEGAGGTLTVQSRANGCRLEALFPLA